MIAMNKDQLSEFNKRSSLFKLNILNLIHKSRFISDLNQSKSSLIKQLKAT